MVLQQPIQPPSGRPHILARSLIEPSSPSTFSLVTATDDFPRHPQAWPSDISVLQYPRVEIRASARKHGFTEDDTVHAIENAIVVADLEPDADPPKILVIGPDRSGNLLEIIILEFADEEYVTIHAMALRPRFHDLLP